jgi:hypothetical protein
VSQDRAARVAWPAVLKYAAEDGLVIVDSLSEWNLDPDLYGRTYHADDRLIDSAGNEYELVYSEGAASAHAAIEPTGKLYTAAGFRTLAARHLKTIGAPEEWLDAHLQDIPESHQMRVTLQYLARLGEAEPDDPAEEEE